MRYWYNAAGSRSGVVRGAGSGGFTTVFYRDALERPTVVANDPPGTLDDAPIELGYNPASQIVNRSVSNDDYAAPVPANTARGYQVNGLNQYTGTTWDGAPNWSFEYDLNGNLKRSIDPDGTGTTDYLYDVENRLVSASGAKNAALVYDPLGRLFQVSGGASGPVQFLYDGDALVAEYSDVQTRWHVYVHGPGVDRPIIWFEGGYGGRRLYADHQGSIVAIAHPTNAWLAINGYDAWGIPNPANAGRFQYTGQVWLPELGMYHYKARVYSPTLGRFLQTDPIGYDDQMNLYAYVENDPMNRVDPFGLDNCQVKQDDGKLVDIPDCKGDKNARPATPGELQQIQGEANIVVTATKQKGSSKPKDFRFRALA